MRRWLKLKAFRRFEKRPIGVWLLLAGACMTLGFAPFGVWPLALLSLALFVALLGRAESLPQVLGLGLIWGLGWQLTSLYWLPRAFYLDANMSLMAGVLGGVPALIGLAFYGAAGVMLVGCLAWGSSRLLGGRFVGFFWMVFWLALEMVKSLDGLGFPWLPVGAIWATWLAPAQLASLAGVYGLSAFTLALAALLAAATVRHAAVAGVVLALGVSFGYARLASAPALPLLIQGQPMVRLVQPNQQSPHKWDPMLRTAFLRDALDLAFGPGVEKVQTVLLPESAVAFFLDDEPAALDEIVKRLGPGQDVVAGTVRQEPTAKGVRYFNSIRVIDQQGLASTYDKRMLVPFGEYIPARSFLESLPLPGTLRTLSQSRIDFTHGVSGKPLALADGSRVGGLVCYEGIFPTLTAKEAPMVSWFLNVTNDNWFTGTIALDQHAALATLRAIETGRPLVRVANTGITRVVDGYGRLVEQLPINRPAVMDVAVPKPLPLTPFVRLMQAVGV